MGLQQLGSNWGQAVCSGSKLGLLGTVCAWFTWVNRLHIISVSTGMGPVDTDQPCSYLHQGGADVEQTILPENGYLQYMTYASTMDPGFWVNMTEA